MLGVSCRILDRSGWCVITLQHSHHLLRSSMSFVCTFMSCWQVHLWLLLEYCGSGLADGCVALVQLVPMGCPVKEDGSVVTW